MDATRADPPQSQPTATDSTDELQADIAAAFRSSIVLPPYDEVLRLIDTLKGHLARLIEQAEEHVKRHRPGEAAWYREHRQIDNAEIQLRAGPGNGLASAARGRDDEFVGVVPKGYTGKRWGEIVGLETEFTGGHQGAKLVDVARRAGVSTGTVSNVLNHPDRVAEATRAKAEQAIADLGFVRGGVVAEYAAHWRRNGFATWLFTPAASGWYPKKGAQEARPVPVLGEPWPGVPARGRNASERADSCWIPIAKGLTPHGLRHTRRTMMEDLGTEKVLMDERMGHLDGSVSARYAHVTVGMRERLMIGLTEQWEALFGVGWCGAVSAGFRGKIISQISPRARASR
ncbi:DUF6415 family natural product biosynthesis protein [Streptomyces sp. BP-8]|uniref:DUF6415 family natural product biosynthesis protein n=1 Tax=Streptomyces sirii TaxID=3127701 RepID=A0ABZ2QPV3_9ACTN